MSILVHDGPGEPNPFNGFAKVLKHGSHDQSSHGKGRGGGNNGKGGSVAGTPAAGGAKSNVAQMASDAGVQIQATGTKGVYNGHPDSTRKYVIMEAEDGTASLSAGTRGRGATLTEHPNVGAAERAMVDHEKRASDMDGLLGSPKRSRDESANWGSGEMGGRYDGAGRATKATKKVTPGDVGVGDVIVTKAKIPGRADEYFRVTSVKSSLAEPHKKTLVTQGVHADGSEIPGQVGIITANTMPKAQRPVIERSQADSFEILKHASHDQSSHGKGRGGSSSSSTSSPSPAASAPTTPTASPSGEPPHRLADLNHDEAVARQTEIKAATAKSMDEVEAAAGNGLQSVETGQLWVSRAPNDPSPGLTNHGAVMRTSEIVYTPGRVRTEYGASAKIKGWKHRDDLQSGDVIALPNTRKGVRAYHIDSNDGKTIQVRAIGKKGKPTGRSQTLTDLDFDWDKTATIIAPTQRK